jgi:TRAP-type C4-dicarboxylate transport system permease small subunit
MDTINKMLALLRLSIHRLLIFCFYLTAVSGTIAIIIFGACGDGRDWMPNWEHNNISWSYALAVFGVLFLYISGILYLVEGRVHHKKRQRTQETTHSAYHMEQRKGHTTI